MVRSINIEKTDQLVWDMVKSALKLTRELSPISCGSTSSEHHDLDDGNWLPTDGITWMSPDQIDLLLEAEKKVVINKMITRITASFDQTSKKHQIDVEFSETVSRWLAPSSVDQQPTAVEQEPTGNPSAALGVSGEDGSGGNAAKRSGGSRINYAADHAYSITVE
jgi:hypothetical protein